MLHDEGWKLFMLLPRKKLEERVFSFQEGTWLRLLLFFSPRPHVRRECFRLGSDRTWELQEGVCHNTGCCARQQSSPTQTSSLFRTSTQEPPLTPGTSAGKSADEILCWDHLPPTSTTRTTRRDLTPPNKFWMSPFLSTLCHGNSDFLVVGCTSPGGAISVQGAHLSCPPPGLPRTVATHPLPFRVGVHRLRWPSKPGC